MKSSFPLTSSSFSTHLLTFYPPSLGRDLWVTKGQIKIMLLFFKIFIQLFLVVLGLHCYTWALVVLSAGYSSLWCVGFSLLWLLLWNSGSSLVVVAHGLRCPKARGLFPDQGLKTHVPCLGGFLTTGPLGKSKDNVSVDLIYPGRSHQTPHQMLHTAH